MNVRTMVVSWTVALALSPLWANQSVVRTIDISDLELGEAQHSSIERPVVITSADELYNAITDDDAASAINGQIDFTKEIVLYFSWIGSGQDTLKATTVRTAKGVEVRFVYKTGMTLDLSPHHHLFAIANDATWRIETLASADSQKR